MEGTPVKFSNRVKAHAWVASLNGLTIRAATIINKKIYAKMISLGELHSVPEVLKIIENEEKAQSIQIQSQPKNKTIMMKRKVWHLIMIKAQKIVVK